MGTYRIQFTDGREQMVVHADHYFSEQQASIPMVHFFEPAGYEGATMPVGNPQAGQQSTSLGGPDFRRPGGFRISEP